MKALFFFVISGLFLLANLRATTIHVPSQQPTIQAGINAATNFDTVLVDTGRYVENINFNGKNIVVGSLLLTTGDSSYIFQTVIDGNQSGRVVKENHHLHHYPNYHHLQFSCDRFDNQSYPQ